MFLNQRMNKQIVVYSYNGILLINKRKTNYCTYNNIHLIDNFLRERNLTKRSAYYMVVII